MEEARCFSLLATVEQAVEADGACAPPLNGIALDGLGTWGGVRKLKGGSCLAKASLARWILV